MAVQFDFSATVTAWDQLFTLQSGHWVVNHWSPMTYNQSWTVVIWNTVKASNDG